MAEGENLPALPLILLGVVFVAIAGGAAFFGELSSKEVHEEILAAAAEGVLVVVVVGVVARWYQWRADQREEKTAVLRELSGIREKVRDAAFLMTAHKSAKTWTEQTRELAMLIPRITDIEETAVPGSNFHSNVSVARNRLEDLKDEYLKKHDAVAQLATDWDAIQKIAPKSKDLVVSDDSPLLKALDESIRSLRQELRLAVSSEVPSVLQPSK